MKLTQRLLLLCLLGVASSGCASIFTGTHQRVTIITDPPQSIVVVVGTPMAEIVKTAGKGTAIVHKLLAILGPAVPDSARAKLELLSLDELITRLVLWAKLDRIPPELVGQVSTLPPFVREQLLGYIGIEDAGLSPLRVNLRKGRDWAVISWHEGYKARTYGLDEHFNWVTLLNVFNLFLGVPIDILTGAWFNIGPSTIELTLTPLPAS